MARVVEMTRQKLKERSSRDTRTLKEVLVYLMYIEMLGHETSWAQAAVIQLCSEKNLTVKKVGSGYLNALLQARVRITLLQPARAVAPWLGLLARNGSTQQLAGRQPGLIKKTDRSSPIRLCLQMAYLATSLLVDPASELSILVTATIQADLKSDNFLVGKLLSAALCACRQLAAIKGQLKELSLNC